MKIAFVINEPAQDANGGYKMVYMYANSMVEAGHDVSIYYWCRKGKLFTNYKLPFAIKYVVAALLSAKGPKWFKLDKRVHGKAVKEISDRTIEDADTVLATAVNTAKPVFELSEKKGKKAYFIQGFENWEFTAEYVYNTYALGMTNIVVAKWLKEIVESHSISKVILIPNGIDTNIFYDQKLNRRKHSIVVQYREAVYKGSEYAIRAIEVLQKKYSDLYVAMISTDNAPKNLPQCCEFFQNISPEKVAEINNKSQVFICTSIEEGYGLPGLEAMACGCAVCSSGYLGVFEYAVDGKNALISPVKDVDSMVDNVCKLFEYEDLREQIVTNGKKTAFEKSHTAKGYLFLQTLQDMVLNTSH